MPVVMALLVGGYWLFVKSKTKQAMAGLGPAMHAHFMRSGFRYPDLPPEPVEAHVQKALFEANAPPPADGNRIIHYVRSFHGMPILFEQAYRRLENGNSISASWSTRLDAPPRIPFQVANKSLSGMGKAVREAFSNMTRNWQPRFPQPVTGTSLASTHMTRTVTICFACVYAGMFVLAAVARAVLPSFM